MANRIAVAPLAELLVAMKPPAAAEVLQRLHPASAEEVRRRTPVPARNPFAIPFAAVWPREESTGRR